MIKIITKEIAERLIRDNWTPLLLDATQIDANLKTGLSNLVRVDPTLVKNIERNALRRLGTEKAVFLFKNPLEEIPSVNEDQQRELSEKAKEIFSEEREIHIF